MKPLIVCILAVLIFPFASHASLPAELLRCKPRTEKGKSEELLVREAAELANLSDHEVLSRLLLAEAVASGFLDKRCNAPSMSALMEAMGWVVMNRVHKVSPDKEDPKPDAFYRVIFEPRQFRTSFSSHADNPYSKIFLCPMEVRTYLPPTGTGLEGAIATFKQAKESAARIMETYQKSGVPSEYARIMNYFLPHAEAANAQRPKWAKDPDPMKNKGFVDILKTNDKPCAEFYRIK